MIRLKNEKGVAILTVLFVLLIVTALAVGAIMLATVQLKVSSSVRQMEVRQSCQEGGIDYIIPLVQYYHYCQSSPCSPPAGYASIVMNTTPSLSDKFDDPTLRNYNDSVYLAPNIAGLQLGQCPGPVAADIDVIGTALLPGGSIEQSQAYHKAAENANVTAYRIMTNMTVGADTSDMCQVVWLKTLM